MSPDTAKMDSTLPSTTSALFNVPKLTEDGSNWITYKERTLTAIGARGLMRYVDGRASKPEHFPHDEDEDHKTPTEARIEALDKKIDEYYQKDSLIKQQIFSTITDRLLLRVQKLESASSIWSEICDIHEGKTELVQIDLRRRLQETKCKENGDVKVHLSKMLRLHESLAGMGASIEDRDFYAILIGSLPEAYRPLLSSINAAAKVTLRVLTPYELINIVSEEYEHRLLTNRRMTKKGANSALSASVKGNGGRGRTSNSAPANPDAVCYNCKRKGHYKEDCWRKGGGKEGQGPNQRKRGANSQKHSANSASSSEPPTDNYAFATSALTSVAEQLCIPVERRGAIIDSGASSHFCPDRAKFENYVPIEPQDIHTADGTTVSTVGRGDVKLDLPLGSERTTVTLRDALYAPKMAFTLVSTNRITAAGMAIHFEGRMCHILTAGPKCRIIAEILHIEGLYSVLARRKNCAVNSAKPKLTVFELHKVLGHVSQTAVLDAMKKGLIEGVELDSASQPEFCEVCMRAKAKCKPFPKETESRAECYGERVHTDLWEDASITSVSRMITPVKRRSIS
jgi:hypothetical protein